MMHLVVSDLHLGRVGLGENRNSCDVKAAAVRTIADFVDKHRADVSLVLLGDIFHRPDGYSPNKGEGFDVSEAKRQIGPLAEVLQEHEMPVSYVPGNCDPWAMGTVGERGTLAALLGQRNDRVSFPGPVLFSDSCHTLFTHGHMFSPGIINTLREWVELPSKGADGDILREAMERPDDPTIRDRLRAFDAKGGSHHVAFLLKTLVLDGLFALPGLNAVRTPLTRSLSKAWDAAHRRAYAEQAAAACVDASTIVMGHTHMPGVYDVGDGRRFVNTGSAGADNTEDGNGTVATITADGVPTLRWSYHRDVPGNRLDPV